MYNIQKSYEIRRLTIRQMRTYHWINSYTSMIAICVTWIGSVRKKLHWTRCPSGSRTPTLHKRFLSALVSSGRARYVGHLGKVVSCYLTAKLHPYHFHSLHLIHSPSMDAARALWISLSSSLLSCQSTMVATSNKLSWWYEKYASDSMIRSWIQGVGNFHLN